jgi:hypothetical protein
MDQLIVMLQIHKKKVPDQTQPERHAPTQEPELPWARGPTTRLGPTKKEPESRLSASANGHPRSGVPGW